jgi:hypothetical protein
LKTSTKTTTTTQTIAITLFLMMTSSSCSILLLTGTSSYSYAQSPPISPPPPSGGASSSAPPGEAIETAADDRSPPVIQVLTSELKEGKNVISVIITDDSSITSRTVKYVYQGKIRMADLARDDKAHYSSLINVQGPTAILVFEVIDANGNVGKVVKELQVVPSSPNIFEQFLRWIMSLFS